MRNLDSREERGAPSAGHAVVIGGSIAGLLIARVLTDHFEKVTIVERDILPLGNEDRPGSPQARHLHLLLMRGLEIIGRLFPEVKAEMIDRIVEFVNATTPEPLDEKATKTGWTNDYAAKALATMKK